MTPLPPDPALTQREFLPARMLNEFVYCPRLFYLEHVEGVFRHNADTIEGRTAHRRVDARPQALPSPRATRRTGTKAAPETVEDASTEDVETIHARSISLASERLGVTAKLDLVEVSESDAAQAVRPVEYKKGCPREGEDGPEIWDADRMQLGVQVLLLRDNGYECTGGLLYYRGTRQRVALDLTPELEAWVMAQIDAARTAMQGPMPPPLSHSPKCPRCSLVSICLPDESAYLAPNQTPDRTASPAQLGLSFGFESQGQATPAPDRVAEGPFADLPEIRLLPAKPPESVRRLMAPNDETRALYLNTPGVWVSKKGDVLVAKEEGQVIGEFRLHDLHHVAVFGPVQLSTQVVQALCERDIPLTWFTLGGWFYAMTRGHSLKNVFTRMEQFRQAADPTSALFHARVFVHGKIRNQRTLLMRNHTAPPKVVLKALKSLSNAALHASSLGMLLGVEGSAALSYFSHFSGMLRGEADESATPECGDDPTQAMRFTFDHRNRRPPRDPINALLSLVYSLLTKDCTVAAYAVGFDPYVGFLHQPRFGRPALALDLMEEFRPLVADSTVLSLVNNRILGPKDFLRAGQAVNLQPKARKAVFEAYERRLADTVTHPVFGYKVSYRRALELQARLLAKALTGEIEQYLPFLTR